MSGLRTYRCFLIDADSHISSAELITCSDDDAAKVRADEIFARNPACRAIAVWDYDRRVHIHVTAQ